MDYMSPPLPNLQEVLIPSLPASGYYLPNFITLTEEAYLLEKVDSLNYLWLLFTLPY